MHFNHPRVSAVNRMATRAFKEREKKQTTKLILWWIHLQHARKAAAFAHWHLLLFLSLQTIKDSGRQMR